MGEDYSWGAGKGEVIAYNTTKLKLIRLVKTNIISFFSRENNSGKVMVQTKLPPRLYFT